MKLAYDVVGQNIRQGREAAGRFREGEYNVRDVPHDTNVLALRLLNLTRELSATSFEILERLLRDANLPGARPRRGAKRHRQQDYPDHARRDHEEEETYADDGQQFGFYPVPPSPRQPTRPATRGVVLTCQFTGARSAVMKGGSLATPDSPTVLGVTTLVSVTGALPAITGVTFSASADGAGILAIVASPSSQPAGAYSGVICSAETQLVLGSLTIEVLP